MKYAWIENERIRDICEGGNPADCYTANVAVYYDTLVPDGAKDGDSYVDGQWTPAPPLPTPPAPPQTWNDVDVRNGLTLTDKTRWDNNSTAELITAKIEFSVPKNLVQTTELLDYLVASQSISEQSKTTVLATAPTTVAYADVSGNQPNVIN